MAGLLIRLEKQVRATRTVVATMVGRRHSGKPRLIFEDEKAYGVKLLRERERERERENLEGCGKKQGHLTELTRKAIAQRGCCASGGDHDDE